MLTVTVVRCSNLRNVARVIRQDPFVAISVPTPSSASNAQQSSSPDPLLPPPVQQPTVLKKTSVAVAGGINPTWLFKNKLRLKVPSQVTEVNVQVWDKEVFQNNRLIGEGKLDLKEWEEDGCEDEPKEIEVFFEGKPAGTVHCIVTYDPPLSDSSLDLGLTEADSTADSSSPTRKRIQTHLSQINNVNMKIPKPMRYALVVIFVFLVVSSWFRYFFYLLLSYGLWYIALLVGVPISAALAMPRFLGYALTKVVAILTMNYPLSFGTITIVPYLTDFETFRFRLTVTDFYMGNPPQAGFVAKKFMSLDRLDLDGSVPFSDLARLIRWDLEKCPLKKVRDFKRLVTFRIDRLEFAGFTLDFQLSTKNRLNINEMTREFAFNECKQSLFIHRKIDPKLFKFPNLLEVQVVRARNLKAMDRNGLSDPYYVLKLRKEKRKSDTIMKCLNPMFPTKIERFSALDPSAVLHLQMWDEDFAKQSDFIGQWIITLKWLLIDPKHCRYLEIEENCPGKDEGWVGMWVPLQDTNFRGEGTRGDVHVRFRWVFSQDFPLERPPISANKAIEQISENRIETRLRLGDAPKVIQMLNHVPVLFDFGLVIVRDAKIGVQDLLFGRQGSSVGGGPTTPRPRSTSAADRSSTAQAPPLRHGLVQQSVSSPPESTTANKKKSPLSFAVLRSASGGSANRRTLIKRESSDVSSALMETSSNNLREASPSVILNREANSNGGANGEEVEEGLEEEGEIEENGRKFAKIKLIEWHTQFAARHGDPGLPLFKVLDRFFRGLAPKLAANQKLHLRLIKHSLKSVNWDDIFSTDRVIAATRQAATMVASTAMGVAKVAQEQKRFVGKKYFSNINHTGLMAIGAQQREDMVSLPPPSRKALASDDDIIIGELLVQGRLEALWENSTNTSAPAPPSTPSRRRRNRASVFYRGSKWKPWFFEIRGKTVFYKKGATASLSAGSWNVLELYGLTGLYLRGPQEGENVDDEQAQQNTELVLRFATQAGAQALHLRLPLDSSADQIIPSVPLQEWVSVFTKLRHVQQAAQGFTPGLEIEEELAPLEDDQQQRAARSSNGSAFSPKHQPVSPQNSSSRLIGRSNSIGGDVVSYPRAASSGGGASSVGGLGSALKGDRFASPRRVKTLPLTFSVDEHHEDVSIITSPKSLPEEKSPSTTTTEMLSSPITTTGSDSARKVTSPTTKTAFSSSSIRKKITSVFG